MEVIAVLEYIGLGLLFVTVVAYCIAFMNA